MVAAEALARRLHATQTDKAGRPYVEHLEAVVRNLRRRWPDAPEHAVAAAWLHDAIEDTDVTAVELVIEGLPWSAVELVVELTRQDSLAYADWIDRLAQWGGLWAIRIKLADLDHNMDATRPLLGSDTLQRRYAPARQALERALVTRFRP